MTLEAEDFNNDRTPQHRQMQLSMIVSITRNGMVGINNRIPVRLPADLRRFRIITANKPVIMGRKTHDSIGRCLPSRTNIVLSRNEVYKGYEGAVVVHKLTDAWQAAYDTGATHAFVIGGAEIFRYFLPACSKLYLTVIDQDVLSMGQPKSNFPIPVEELLKWDGKMVQSFNPGTTNTIQHRFYILNVPDVDQLSGHYDVPLFNGVGVA